MVILSLPYLGEQKVPEISREPTELPGSAKTPLSLCSGIRLQDSNLVSNWELETKNNFPFQRKSSTSQEQIWVSSELNNLCKRLAFPYLEQKQRNHGADWNNTPQRAKPPPPSHHASTLCQHCRLPLQSETKQAQSVLVGEYFPTYFWRASTAL